MFLKRNKLQKVLNFYKILGRRHLKFYLPTVMFRGTPCMLIMRNLEDCILVLFSLHRAHLTKHNGFSNAYSVDISKI